MAADARARLARSIEHEVAAYCDHTALPAAPCDECQMRAQHKADGLVGLLLTDANFNDIIRVLGGKVAGLDQRMRAEWGSSVLFKQGGDLYD